MRLGTMFALAHKENAVKKFIAKVTQTEVLVEIHFRLRLGFSLDYLTARWCR